MGAVCQNTGYLAAKKREQNTEDFTINFVQLGSVSVIPVVWISVQRCFQRCHLQKKCPYFTDSKTCSLVI